MTSLKWKNSNMVSDPDHDYTYDCLLSRKWWDNVKLVLDVIGPLYTVLRFADSQKLGSLSGFMSQMMNARQHMDSAFLKEDLDKDKYLKVLDKREGHLYKNTLMVAGIIAYCLLPYNCLLFAAILFLLFVAILFCSRCS